MKKNMILSEKNNADFTLVKQRKARSQDKTKHTIKGETQNIHATGCVV